ncbi:MAG: hypothetical protein ABIA63_00860 [bacterium]
MEIVINTEYDIGDSVDLNYDQYKGRGSTIQNIEIEKWVKQGYTTILYVLNIDGKELKIDKCNFSKSKYHYSYDVQEGNIIIWENQQYSVISAKDDIESYEPSMGAATEYSYRKTILILQSTADQMKVITVPWNRHKTQLAIVERKNKDKEFEY